MKFNFEVIQVNGVPGGSVVRNPPANARCRRRGFNPWVTKIPWEEEMATHSSILAEITRGQRSLVGYSPWGSKELDTPRG